MSYDINFNYKNRTISHCKKKSQFTIFNISIMIILFHHPLPCWAGGSTFFIFVRRSPRTTTMRGPFAAVFFHTLQKLFRQQCVIVSNRCGILCTYCLISCIHCVYITMLYSLRVHTYTSSSLALEFMIYFPIFSAHRGNDIFAKKGTVF